MNHRILGLALALGLGLVTSCPAASGVRLGTFRDPAQGAFTLLVPAGWSTDGGMLPSGVGWNVVDLVENNIRFRATHPDGKSFFGWYPRFYFQDPALIMRNSWGMIRKAPGEVMNGCWLFPYMGVADYVKNVVFPYMAKDEFVSPRLVGGVHRDESLTPWMPKGASRCDAGSVDFLCTLRGTPSRGRLYVITYEIAGVIWTTVGTFGWVAPVSRWKEDARVMECCIRSFRLDPQWVVRASAAARKRAEGYDRVMRDVQRIGREIQEGRSQAVADMQHEMHKVLTGQIETWDGATGEKAYLPAYGHAYTDGRGNYYLRDGDDGTLPFENAAEWRELTIVNRNEGNAPR